MAVSPFVFTHAAGIWMSRRTSPFVVEDTGLFGTSRGVLQCRAVGRECRWLCYLSRGREVLRGWQEVGAKVSRGNRDLL